MQLLSEAEFETQDNDRVFREPALGRVLLILFIGALGVVWTGLPLVAGPWGFAGWLVGLPCLLAGGLGARGALRGLKGGHWVVRLRRDGIALHLRSYLNADLPAEDPVVLWIGRQEIAGLVPVRHRRRLPGDDGDFMHTERRVEIRLTHARTADLRRALERERSPANRQRTHHHAYLVRLASADRIEISWRSARGVIRPGLKRFLEAARVDYPVEAPLETRLDDWRELDPRAFDDLVLELCEQGDTFAAVRLLRSRHGWSLAQAKGFVDELRGPRGAA